MTGIFHMLVGQVVAAVAAGKNLFTWGDNTYGSTGSGTSQNSSVPKLLDATSVWNSLSASTSAMGGIKSNGTLWTWGDNTNGGLGFNDRVSRSSPTQVGSLTNWSKLYAVNGGGFIAVKTDGTLWSWGDNSFGQLGQNIATTARLSSPVQIGAATDWASVPVGAGGSLIGAAIKTTGTLWTWGYNADGGLGQNNVTSRSSPVQVGALTDWAEIAFSGSTPHALARKTGGTIWTWGGNPNGQLGNNNIASRSSPAQVGSGTNWASIDVGANNSFAVTTDNTLFAWGNNNLGQLGDNSIINRSSPVQIGATGAYKASFGTTGSNGRTLIKTSDGTLWGVGTASVNGMSGAGGSINVSSPTQVGAWLNKTFTKGGGGGTNVAYVIDSDNDLYTWVTTTAGAAAGATGYLVSGAALSSPVQVGSSEWASVSFNGVTGAGVKQNGTLWVWGSSTTGGLGISTYGYYSYSDSPVQVGTGTDWASVTVGGTTTLARMFATKTNNTLWAWGDNTEGQLGQNNRVNYSSPVQVGALTNWASVSTTNGINACVLAVKTDGTLWGWGRNNLGQIGDNTIVDRSSPVQIGALTTWASASAGALNGYAITTSGALWAWGQGTNGANGDNTVVGRSSPVQIAGTWAQASGGSTFALFRDTSGRIYAVGANTGGRLGTNDVVSRSAIVQIGAATNWTWVSAGDATSLAIRGGGLYTWGAITSAPGLIGDNANVSRSSPVQIGALTNWSSGDMGSNVAGALKS